MTEMPQISESGESERGRVDSMMSGFSELSGTARTERTSVAGTESAYSSPTHTAQGHLTPQGRTVVVQASHTGQRFAGPIKQQAHAVRQAAPKEARTPRSQQNLIPGAGRVGHPNTQHPPGTSRVGFVPQGRGVPDPR